MRRFVMIVAFVFLLAGTAAADMPGLAEGTAAPDFTAPAAEGGEVRLSELLKEGPVVLVFYRGSWCYYCNLQLRDLQAHYPEFEEAGVRLVALSVDKPVKASEMVEAEGYDFTVVSDPQAGVLEKYGLIFTVPEETAKLYKEKYDIDLEEASGRTDHVIAVPAVYIIDRDGTIVYAYANEDYKVRKSAEELLQIIGERL